MWRQVFIVAVLAVVIMLLFENCAKVEDTPAHTITTTKRASQSPPAQETPPPGSDTTSQPSVNQLKFPRPALIQGRDGYAYLLKEYLFANCAACHDATAFTKMPMAATDLDVAWTDAKRYAKDSFLRAVTQNKFCGSTCNLSPQGEVYKAIAEWLDHRE